MQKVKGRDRRLARFLADGCYNDRVPKIIDADARRREIAEAACRVIIEQGLPALSLAAAGERAGLAVGSVRHYVGGHDDLRRLTLTTVGERQLRRLTASAQPLLVPQAGGSAEARRRRILDWLEQLLPMDEERLGEATVWTAMREAARTDPELAGELARIEDRRLELVRRVLGRIRPRWSHDTAVVEARRLAALLRGLTLERVYAPARVTPAYLQQVLRRHLATLASRRPDRRDR